MLLITQLQIILPAHTLFRTTDIHQSTRFNVILVYNSSGVHTDVKSVVWQLKAYLCTWVSLRVAIRMPWGRGVLHRQTAAGDQLRVIYDQLSKDPNSLSNLDQDLPNYTQHQVTFQILDTHAYDT